jgi:ubiquinone/menaquinone biosynthesis C-methylase UbiE
MNDTTIEKEQGHWLLAKMGKKVLRPGGKELTLQLINELNISTTDDIIEFAPGLGFTAAIALSKQPQSYTGVERDERAVQLLRQKINGNNRQILAGNAAYVPLKSETAHKVYGEAMLTMHADHRKAEIIREAARLLKPGGLYGIHEMGLTPKTISEQTKADIQKELAVSLKVNARPLTQPEWVNLLEKEGFKIIKVMHSPMHLLETKRVIEDEGLLRTLKIGFNVCTHPKAARRILAMRSVFVKYERYINAIAIVAQKAG